MSKKNVHVLMSAVGWITSFVSALLEALLERGISPEKIHAFVTNDGKASIAKIVDILVGDINEYADAEQPKSVPVVGKYFLTVKLGTYKSVDAILQAILATRKNVGTYADQILSKIPISPVEVELDIWEITVADLGFTSATSRKDIYKRALELGFEKCPAEVGPLARLQNNETKWRLVGMDPITDSDGDPSVFSLYSVRDGLWLDAARLPVPEEPS